MQSYFIPLLALSLENTENNFVEDRYELLIRKWEVSIFDLATLAIKHNLHISYELIAVFLQHCNMELIIYGSTLENVKLEANIVKAMLYVNNVSPFIYPYISTHSINDYAGINSRDSETLQTELPEGLRNGMTSDKEIIEIWPFELTFETIQSGKKTISNEVFKKAISNITIWKELLSKFSILNNIQSALAIAPFITDKGQSLLYIWTAIESIFPTINQEVSFRISLYISQLNKSKEDRYKYLLEVKKAYGIRSKIAHGTTNNITIAEWETAWNLLIETCQSIINRGTLPNEQELLEELLIV